MTMVVSRRVILQILYIDSPKWTKKEKATVNPKISSAKFFYYAVTAALNHKNIEAYPDRLTRIRPFIDKHEWYEVNFSTLPKGKKKFELNNTTITSMSCLHRTIRKK